MATGVTQTGWLLLFFLWGMWPGAVTAQERKDPAVSISTAHALFGQQCALCHEPLRGVSEKLCLKCHAGPLHAATQAVTPPCGSCHTEHQGNARLALIANDRCVECHAEVPVQAGVQPTFARTITDFTKDHPQFAVSVGNGKDTRRLRLDDPGARQSDRTTLIFPHERHLRADLKGPKGIVQLACKDCHVPERDGRAMAPIDYETHCQQCHPLGFDPQFPDRVVPHGDVLYLHSYLIMTFAEKPPVQQPVPQPRGRVTRPLPSVAPITISPSVAQRVAAAERYLYTVTCNKCHLVEGTQRPLPRVVEPGIPRMWFPHAQFAHRPHRMLECAACHEGVRESKKAADVLLPGIQVCQPCHRVVRREEVTPVQGGAPADCVTCHLYHNKAEDVEWNGPFFVQQLVSGGGTQATPSPTEQKP